MCVYIVYIYTYIFIYTYTRRHTYAHVKVYTTHKSESSAKQWPGLALAQPYSQQASERS